MKIKEHRGLKYIVHHCWGGYPCGYVVIDKKLDQMFRQEAMYEDIKRGYDHDKDFYYTIYDNFLTEHHCSTINTDFTDFEKDYFVSAGLPKLPFYGARVIGNAYNGKGHFSPQGMINDKRVMDKGLSLLVLDKHSRNPLDWKDTEYASNKCVEMIEHILREVEKIKERQDNG